MSAEPKIKHRVTGAFVLIALAVIFLPLILDGQKKNQILDSRIPQKPVSGEIILLNVEDKSSKPVDKQKPIAKKVVSEPVAVKKSAVKKPAVKKPTVKKTIKPVSTELRENRPNFKTSAFVIQIGSFSNKANAQKLVDKLKTAGYKAYLRSGKSNGKMINRVLVGPDLKRQQAERKINALNKISGLKAIIVAYDPLRH